MEIPFVEKRLKLGEVFLVPPTIAGQQGTQPVFARIDHVPIAMMSCPIQEKLNAINQEDTFIIHRMSGFCQERYFESLPGFIDVAVLTSFELDETTGE